MKTSKRADRWLLKGLFYLLLAGLVPAFLYQSRLFLKPLNVSSLPLAIAQEQTADHLVQQGREALLQKDMVSANGLFYSALQLNQNHEEANFFYAITRILVLFCRPEFNSLLDRLGVSSEGRNLYQWEADFTRDSYGEVILPAEAATSGEIQTYLENYLKPQIEGALANLDKISQSFNIQVSSEVLSDEVLEVDYADVLMGKSLYQSAKAALLIINSYDLNLDLEVVFHKINKDNFSLKADLLNAFPQLLTLVAPEKMPQAKEVIIAAIEDYLLASATIKEETDPQDDDLIALDVQEIEDEEKFLNQLQEIKTWLTQNISTQMHLDDYQCENLTVNLSRFFDQPVGRNQLPQLDDQDHIIFNTFPDPTFHGLLPTTTQTDLTCLLRDKSHLWGGYEAEHDGSYLFWSKDNYAEFISYSLYRDTSPCITPQSSLRLITITDRNTTSYDDYGLPELTRYYYRVYTLYSDGSLCGSDVFMIEHTASTGRALFTNQDGLEVLRYIGNSAIITVWDADMDKNPGFVDQVVVDVTSDTQMNNQFGPEVLILQETGINTGIFQGSLPFDTAQGIGVDQDLVVRWGDRLYVAYHDLSNHQGLPQISEDQAIYGQRGPSLGQVLFTDQQGHKVKDFVKDQAIITLRDSDLDANPEPAETVVVKAGSSTQTNPELVTLTETGPSSGIFRGSIPFILASGLIDGQLDVALGDELWVYYDDEANDLGQFARSKDKSLYFGGTWFGYLDEDTTWSKQGSPYIISGDLIVSQQAILRIEPGVEVRFWANYDHENLGQDDQRGGLMIHGRLIAEGTAAEPIIFTSHSEEHRPGDWGCLWVSGAGSAQMHNCQLRYAVSGVYAENTIVNLTDCLVEYCQSHGIIFHGEGADGLVLRTVVEYCQGRGFFIYGGSDAVIRDCSSRENGSSGMALGSGTILVEGSRFVNNGKNNWWNATGLGIQWEEGYNDEGPIVIRGCQAMGSRYGLYSQTPDFSSGTSLGITIDGNYQDWDVRYRIYLDADGPDCGDAPGQDIKEVYIAQDNDFIYLRYVLNDTLDETFGYKFGEDLHIQVAKPYGISYYIPTTNGGYNENLPDSFVYISDNQFECKFYKADVQVWQGKGINAWCDQGDNTVCRDHVSLLPLDIDFPGVNPSSTGQWLGTNEGVQTTSGLEITINPDGTGTTKGLSNGQEVNQQWNWTIDDSKSPQWIDLTITSGGPVPPGGNLIRGLCKTGEGKFFFHYDPIDCANRPTTIPETPYQVFIKAESFITHTANGTYTYEAEANLLTLNITSSDFVDDGPSVGTEKFSIQSITSTTLTWTNEGGELGVYGPSFEFEFESLIPKTIGTYHIGSDFEAIDFQNSDTPYNLHAYGGSVTITSVSPMFEGTFTLTNFAPDHGEAPSLAGNVTGSFSVPYDGSASGIFIAHGLVDGYAIDLNESIAHIQIEGNDQMTWTREDGPNGDLVGRWEIIISETGSTYEIHFDSDGNVLVVGSMVNYVVKYTDHDNDDNDESRLVLENCLIGGTEFGVYIKSGRLRMSGCDLSRVEYASQLGWAVYNQSSNNLDCRYNYWGDQATEQMMVGGNPKNIGGIYDRFDNLGAGQVDYSHWLDESPNSRPVVRPISVCAIAGLPLEINLIGYDLDGDQLSHAIAALPSHGEVEVTGKQAIYTAHDDFTGYDAFTYTAFDGEFTSAPAPLRLLVKPAIRPEQTADDLVLLGRDSLREKCLPVAHLYFAYALQRDQEHQEANFFYALTRILALLNQSEFNSLLDRLGVNAWGRDFYQWEADFTTDSYDEIILPENSPTGGEIQGFINNSLLPQINEALKNLGKIDPSFRIEISDEVLSDEAIEIDYGDVLMGKSQQLYGSAYSGRRSFYFGAYGTSFAFGFS